ncbi:hypothetical protein O9992_01790 [Vibrio lentus]|nr:hypothetical protein [Vibrio lentus]
MNSTFIVNFVGKHHQQQSSNLLRLLTKTTKWLISKVNFIEDQVAGVLKVQLPAINESIVKEAFSANADLIDCNLLIPDHTHNAQDTICIIYDSTLTTELAS